MRLLKTSACVGSILVLTAFAAGPSAMAQAPATTPAAASPATGTPEERAAAVQAAAALIDGSDVFYKRCYSCHTGEVGAKAHSPDTLATFTKERIVNALTNGIMNTQGAGLSPAQRQAVANFLVDGTIGGPAPQG